jgi:hypothetical protein
MTETITANERTAVGQKVVNQPDGPGLRIGKEVRFPVSAN